MQEAPKYDDVFAEVNRCFIEQIARCEKAGIAKVFARPRIRFGKISLTITLLARLGEFHHLTCAAGGHVVKRWLVSYLTWDHQTSNSSLACAVIAAMQGAQIIRVHDVKRNLA